MLYEVLEALRQHNTNPATAAEDRIEIDVLTGASAGGMTAIILGQKLLYNGDEFRDPYDNPVYKCWVERICLKELQDTQDNEPCSAIVVFFRSDWANLQRDAEGSI